MKSVFRCGNYQFMIVFYEQQIQRVTSCLKWSWNDNNDLQQDTLFIYSSRY